MPTSHLPGAWCITGLVPAHRNELRAYLAAGAPIGHEAEVEQFLHARDEATRGTQATR